MAVVPDPLLRPYQEEDEGSLVESTVALEVGLCAARASRRRVLLLRQWVQLKPLPSQLAHDKRHAKPAVHHGHNRPKVREAEGLDL